ncbi:MAG: hypothetical protein ACLKAK_08495 [Alkaliphilus sp.]
MQEKKTYSLYIPQGLKTRIEIFDGYAKEEFYKTMIMTIGGGVVSLCLYLFLENLVVSIVIILTVVAGSVMMLTKDISNISVVDQVGFMIKYLKRQKKYRYKYLDEWK